MSAPPSGGSGKLLRDALAPRALAASAAWGIVYFLAGRLGLTFATVDPSASPVWPASGIALAAFLIHGDPIWPGIFLGSFAVNLSTSGRPLMSIGIATGNTIAAVVGARLMNRFNEGRQDFERPGDVWRFFVFGGLIGTAVAATLGLLSLLVAGARPENSGSVWLTWWLGDAVGVLLVTPVILLWRRRAGVRFSSGEIFEGILLFVGIVVVGQALFGGWLPARLESYPLDFLCVPMLVWVAYRFTQREAAAAVLVLAAVALVGTLSGSGPFAGDSRNDSLLLLQAFLGIAAVMTLVFAAVVGESRRGLDTAARMATIVGTSGDAIVTKALDGTITSWNPAAEELFGWTSEEAVGRNIALIIPEDLHHEEETMLAKLVRGEMINDYETVRMKKDGTTFPISLTISPLKSADGRIIGVSKIGRDISDRARLASEREALLEREKAARADAEAVNRAKDEFLAILSHELRTPLNAVYGWARMMQSGQLDDGTAARALDAIVRNANAQVQLIDDLLDVSRVINGKMRLDVRPTDVRGVVEAALDAVRPSAEAKGLRLEGIVDPRGALINGDPVRLQQVVWNLLMNAVKFTPSGGHVQLRFRRTPTQAEITVTDTGQGIPASALPFIFDRFRQWDSSSTRAHSGLGLGLALVKHLTELHRGTVAAESSGEGMGATFRVTLPLTIASQLAPGEPAAPVGALLGAAVRLDGLRVLAVDDEPDALELASAILGSAGATVRTCRSAAEGLALVRSWHPDVLVSDIDMPGEDGYSLIKKVRALGEEDGGRTPAIALTAYGRMEDRVQTLSSGYSMHLPKPVDPEEFTTIVASVARVFRPSARSD